MAIPWQLSFLLLCAGALLMASRLFGVGTSTAPVPWPRAFGTSECLSQFALMVYRKFIAAVFVFFLIMNMVREWDHGHWFIYLTHWSLLLETVYLVFLARFADTYDDFMLLSSNMEQPAVTKAFTVIFMIQLPLTITVLILYWVLVKPVWDLCVFRQTEPCEDLPDLMGFFALGIDTVLVLLSYALGRVPYYFGNAGWFFVFCVVYLIWTLLHFYLKIGTYTPWEAYPQNECPIYDAIDWHDPERTLRLVCLMVFVAGPVLVALSWAIGSSRDCAGSAKSSGDSAKSSSGDFSSAA